MRYFNYVVGLMLLISGGFLSSNAVAASYCTSSPSTPYTMALGAVSVPTDLTNGSDIPGTQRSVTFSGSCRGASVPAYAPVSGGMPIITCYYGTGNEVPGYPGVYSTGVNGIGIAIRNTGGSRVSGAGIGCDTRAYPLGYVGYDSNLSYSYTVTLALVKTGSFISSATLDQSQTKFGMGVYNTAVGIGSSVTNYVAYSGNISLKSVTCTVPSPLNVDLGTFPTTIFTSIGTVSTSKNLNVPVTCDSPVTVKTTITSSSYASSSNGVVGLTPGTGVATGVGIQMLYNSNPVPFGSPLSTGNVYVANGTLNIPFDFRYYQTLQNVTPGDANATVTLAIEYQ